MLTVGDTFSGIGALKLAFQRSGAATLWNSEIKKQSCSILKRHFPDCEQLGDIHHVGRNNAAPVTLICGGSPCQDFSIAGGRKGLAGKESKLFYEYIRLIRELRPAVALWENVYGAFSANNGHDFASIIRAFQECGARDIAWRTLDAQFAGVPQRRRRVFIIADFRACRAGEILFEPESAYGDSPPRKETGTEIAFALTSSNQRNDASSNETFIGVQAFNARSGQASNRVAGTLQARAGRGSLQAAPLITGTLRSAMSRNGGIGGGVDQDLLVVGTLAASGAGTARAAGQANELDFCIPDKYRVRRLTPTECERLQGFPDGWTEYGHDDKPMSDTARYSMLGNAIAVPPAEWIARRMVEVLNA